MNRRICVFGGPGSGKSTTVARLYSELAVNGFEIEHVQEYVKKWAIEKKSPSSFDEVYLFAKQMYTEDRILRHINHVITDCPLLMCCFYATVQNMPGSSNLFELAREFDRSYPSVNIVLDRQGIPYRNHGRYQTEEEALVMDGSIEYIVDACTEGNYRRIKTIDFDSILDYVTSKVSEEIDA